VPERKLTPPVLAGPAQFSTSFRSYMLANHTEHRHGDYLEWKIRFLKVYDTFVTERMAETIQQHPVKIAILDTGLDMTHPDVEARLANIRETCNWTNGRSYDKNIADCNGHGTHTAGLILDYAADAELYVAKIADNEPCHPDIVARVSNSIANNSC
jgi:hypothetical protein